MAYRIQGNIVIDNNGNIRNVGVATIGLIDGKVSEKAITQQTDGARSDVTGADELLLYDEQTASLLRVTVDEFIEGSGIGTITSAFDQLTVTGISTFQGQIQRDGTGIGLTVANDGYVGGQLEVGGLIIAGSVFGDGQTEITGNLNVSGVSTLQGPVYLSQIRTNGFQVLSADGSEAQMTSNLNGPVQLFFDNAFKFSTANDGIRVLGVVTAQSGVVTYYGDGSGLTNVTSSVGNLNDVGDVNVPSPTDGQALVYDNAAGEWVPGVGPAFTVDANNNVYAEELSGNPPFTGAGINNLIIGLNAGTSMTGGYNNVLFGQESGCSLTTGNDNIAIGCQALRCGQVVFSNTVMGNESGESLCSNANVNVLIGTQAGQFLGDSNCNIAIGVRAFRTVCTNATPMNGIGGNVVIGSRAMGNAEGTPSFNTAVGDCAGFQLQSCRNALFGTRAGLQLTTGGCNTLIGDYAGVFIGTGQYNTFVGQYSGNRITTGNRNIILGSYSLSATATAANFSGSDNIFIGNNIQQQNNSTCNIIIGSNTTQLITGPNLVIGFGNDAWVRGTSAYEVIFNAMTLTGLYGGTGDIVSAGSMQLNGSVFARGTMGGIFHPNYTVLGESLSDPFPYSIVDNGSGNSKSGTTSSVYEFTVSPGNSPESPSRGTAGDYVVNMAASNISYIEIVVTIQDDNGSGGNGYLVDRREFFWNGSTIFSPGYTLGTTVTPTHPAATTTHSLAYTDSSGVLGFLIDKTAGGGASDPARVTLYRKSVLFHRDVATSGVAPVPSV